MLLKEIAIITDEKRGHGFDVEQIHKKVLRERKEDKHIVIIIQSQKLKKNSNIRKNAGLQTPC